MKINVNLDKRLGKIKDMNATGQAPLTGGIGKEQYGYRVRLPKRIPTAVVHRDNTARADWDR